ncbi:probable tRNA (guanine(26)-N(2))-dimethyltransferase 1 isoform X3 [Brachypodium distachyon]|uniref:probable tRNA (guanine(26)-N(2))-dimethyltransferase 1 isoform X3 n=1 Tax=Brachypodium distachyon TaxID=15368 RepID=UPI000D0D28B8|nr:probable tRNA (guanine(26)-N(2))-dimethyltransferase 1 isoform X3 [Brachypodium distachyon]|eukprot:XP_024316320.1 probable tRNA (guanine(26)-N(2))-dimethyltransferase 1 isoform X3 [Brachypodium distachyon]
MTLAFGFSRFLNPRVNPSTNPILGLWLFSCSCSCSSSASSAPEPPELAGGPGTIREGRAEIFADKSNSVFYNKAQVNNRDLSIAVLRSFLLKRQEEHDIRLVKGRHAETPPEQHANDLDPVVTGSEDTAPREESKIKAPKVLEALAASGLRAIRYALEVDGIGEVVAVDNNEEAIEACKKNIYHNAIPASSKGEFRTQMSQHPVMLLKVDLDPYGSPAAFLDSAVQCVADGGILMCSATDMAVLAGGNPEVCFSKYGSYPVRGKYCHEMALRILLACIESHAIRHKRYIVPVISVHMDFYIRVFVRIFTSASTVKTSPLKISHVYQCVGCNSFHLQNVGRINSKDKRNVALPNFCPTVPQECCECGHKFVMGGPIWSDPIHDKEWATSILSNVQAMSGAYPAYAKISAVLTSVSQELVNAPLFVSLHSLCATLKCTNPTMAMFHSALRNAGYQISGSHVDPLALKTDAPMSVIWDIMRCWVKLHPVKSRPGADPSNRILSQEPKLQASFSQATGGLVARKSPRFVPNPEKYWGPKAKAGRPLKTPHMDNCEFRFTANTLEAGDRTSISK